nr:hypothetical protein 31 [bacterium]
MKKSKPNRLSLSKIYPNGSQPRKIFEEKSLHELAASIKKHGILQPLVVRPDGEGRYMIVAGERRYRASQMLGLKTVPVIIKNLTDAKLTYQAIIENLQREDITPLEEAWGYKRAMDKHKLTVERLANQIGISQPHRIRERLSLLDLNPEYQHLLEKGLITPSQAYYMSIIPSHLQAKFFNLIKRGKCDSTSLASTARAFVEIDSQDEMFAEERLSADEVKVLKTFETKINTILNIVSNCFNSDGNVVILQKIDPARAASVAEKLKVIRKTLVTVEKKLLEPVAQQQVLEELCEAS